MVSDGINYDLIMKIKELSENVESSPDLIGVGVMKSKTREEIPTALAHTCC